jgi:electron transfer flavoprotein beta subunit
MKIIVCLKQVPESQEIRLDPVTHNLLREGVKSIINPFDLYALEEGLRVRERHGGEVIVLSMGPPQAEAALREALTYGADQGVLLSDRAFAGADTWATAYTLAAAVRRLGGADLIFCGKQAIDGDTAQVGPELAAFLDIPHVAWARQLTFTPPDRLQVERLLDHGYDLVEVELPALITVVKEINEPRLPSFKAKLRAKSAVVPVLSLADLDLAADQVGFQGSFTRVVHIFPPPPRGNREMLQGSPEEMAAALWSRLQQRQVR